MTVNRKYQEQWSGKLPTRLHVISNELPRLGDASTAIVGRIVLLLGTRSWLGKEDHELERKLERELAGILNWSLAGLHRLTFDNGNRFTQVKSRGRSHHPNARSGQSPVGAFVREMCVVGPLNDDADEREVGVERTLLRVQVLVRGQRAPESLEGRFRP